MESSKCEEERKLQLQELEEFLLEAYVAVMCYKEKTKLQHDKNLRRKWFEVGQKVLLFQSRLKIMPGILKSKWTGPYKIRAIQPNGAIKIQRVDSSSPPFVVNGYRLKIYLEPLEAYTVQEIPLYMPQVSN
ncbi:uncharacterized protein LOC121796893 [Salvia splendens]|uniref:uncharacterized protein LOC121796893 n=1 Tax=Salvia splendens TaxID=180675 RepID=UPI001C255E42|nr:uncharacterized protein LOC121796893 [Salvia splendens]